MTLPPGHHGDAFLVKDCTSGDSVETVAADQTLTLPCGAKHWRPSSSRTIVGVLVLLSLVTILLRLKTAHEAFERDLCVYAVAANELLHGGTLYADAWDHKPPGIVLTYAAFIALVGYNDWAIFLLNVLGTIWVTVSVFLAVMWGGRSWRIGLWAAGCWTLFSGCLYLQGNQPNTELFINATLTLAFALFVRGEDKWRPFLWSVLVGACLALASLYKQLAVFDAAILTLIWLASQPRGLRRRQAFVQLVPVVGIGALVWIGVFAYFYFKGTFAAFYEAAFEFNRSYPGNMGSNLLHSLHPKQLLSPGLEAYGPFLLVGFLGALLALRKSWDRKWGLWLGSVVATQIMVGITGRAYLHYYSLWLPVAIVGAGWAIAAWLRAGAETRRVAIVVLACFAVLTGVELRHYCLPVEEWPLRKYKSEDLNELKYFGQWLGRALTKDEKMFECGASGSLYYYSGKRPATRLFYVDPLLNREFSVRFSKRLLSDLDKAKPDLILLDTHMALIQLPGEKVPLQFSFFRDYEQASQAKLCGRYVPLVRIGSDLQARAKDGFENLAGGFAGSSME